MIAMSVPPVTEPRRERRIGRGIVAVLAGFLAIVVLDNGLDFVVHATGIFPPFGQPMADSLFLLALAYRTVDAIIGTYLVGRLAPHHPRRHSLALGSLGVVLSSLGVVATVYGGPELGPIWYPLALVAISLPCAWIGGTLAQWSRGQRTD
jgi:hypothetical protein